MNKVYSTVSFSGGWATLFLNFGIFQNDENAQFERWFGHFFLKIVFVFFFKNGRSDKNDSTRGSKKPISVL